MDQFIGYADVPERGAERLGAEVEMVLIPGSGVDPDGPQPAQGFRMYWHHADRIPVQPALPDGGPEHSRQRIERQVHRAVRPRGEACRHAEHL